MGSPSDPLRVQTSNRLSAAAATRTTTSPGPGTGSGRSFTETLSGPPYSSMTTARIVEWIAQNRGPRHQAPGAGNQALSPKVVTPCL